MSKFRNGLAVGSVLVALAAGAGTSHADDPAELMTPRGVAVAIGLGVEDFTGETMRDTTDTCGSWDARAILGTRSYLGFEAGYLGTATGVYAPLGGEDAVLVSTTVEALARANFIARGAFQPYAVIGAGWRRFDVAQEDFSTSSAGMNDTDDELVIPMGAGLAYRYGSLLADARFTFRVATEESLVLEDGAAATSDDYAPMHTWGVTTRIGYEF